MATNVDIYQKTSAGVEKLTISGTGAAAPLSSAVNSTAEDVGANSLAVKTAYDKGVAAQTTADGKVSKSLDDATGVLPVANGGTGATSASGVQNLVGMPGITQRVSTLEEQFIQGVYLWSPDANYVSPSLTFGPNDSKLYQALSPSGPGVAGVGAKQPGAAGSEEYWLDYAASITPPVQNLGTLYLNRQVIETSGVFVVPESAWYRVRCIGGGGAGGGRLRGGGGAGGNTTFLTLTGYGGGGGGGSGRSTEIIGGGGGGGAGEVVDGIFQLEKGRSIPVVVGAGGLAATVDNVYPTGNNGNQGENAPVGGWNVGAKAGTGGGSGGTGGSGSVDYANNYTGGSGGSGGSNGTGYGSGGGGAGGNAQQSTAAGKGGNGGTIAAQSGGDGLGNPTGRVNGGNGASGAIIVEYLMFSNL